MNFKQLHEEFIVTSRRPMTFGRLPINVREIELPVVPMNKWKKEGNPKKLMKVFDFYRPADRNLFISSLLEYENEVGHHALITLDEGYVRIELITKNTEQITELDKEYASFADISYKDLILRPDRSISDTRL